MQLKEYQDHLKDVLFSIERIFSSIEQEQSVLAVPFFVTAKHIRTDCAYCYAGNKIAGDGTLPKYCAHPEHINIYLTLHAKIVNCTNCQNFIKE